MAAEQVRSDFEQLQSIAGQFRSASDTANGMAQSLKSKMEVLRGGDWVGEGAKKFYAEMDGALMPSLKRLTNALNEASRVTNAVAKIMKQAEDDCSSLFRV